jgi:hypothetical protein
MANPYAGAANLHRDGVADAKASTAGKRKLAHVQWVNRGRRNRRLESLHRKRLARLERDAKRAAAQTLKRLIAHYTGAPVKREPERGPEFGRTPRLHVAGCATCQRGRPCSEAQYKWGARATA